MPLKAILCFFGKVVENLSSSHLEVDELQIQRFESAALHYWKRNSVFLRSTMGQGMQEIRFLDIALGEGQQRASVKWSRKTYRVEYATVQYSRTTGEETCKAMGRFG